MEEPKELQPPSGWIEALRSSESLSFTVLEFNCVHDHLLAKFKQRNIFISAEVPSSVFQGQADAARLSSVKDSYK